MQRLLADYPSAESFMEAVELEASHGGLLIRNATASPGERDCLVSVLISGQPVAELHAQIGAVGRTGVAVVFNERPTALIEHAEHLRKGVPLSAPPKGTAADRIGTLTVAEKIRLAMSGDREARLALMRDHNKVLHPFVLKNPRIQLDEVIFASRLATLSPDALKQISEHPEWGQNIQICTALVRNPRSPLPVALRLLPKLSSTDIRAIARGGGRDQIVWAARKLLSAGGG